MFLCSSNTYFKQICLKCVKRTSHIPWCFMLLFFGLCYFLCQDGPFPCFCSYPGHCPANFRIFWLRMKKSCSINMCKNLDHLLQEIFSPFCVYFLETNPPIVHHRPLLHARPVILFSQRIRNTQSFIRDTWKLEGHTVLKATL